MDLMHRCRAPCLFAKPFADMQRRVFMCSSACICARRLFICRAPMHVCTTPCLSAAAPACMHGGVFICKGPCIYAERHVCLHTSCACVQRRVFMCTSTCTRSMDFAGERSPQAVGVPEDELRRTVQVSRAPR